MQQQKSRIPGSLSCHPIACAQTTAHGLPDAEKWPPSASGVSSTAFKSASRLRRARVGFWFDSLKRGLGTLLRSVDWPSWRRGGPEGQAPLGAKGGRADEGRMGLG